MRCVAAGHARSQYTAATAGSPQSRASHPVTRVKMIRGYPQIDLDSSAVAFNCNVDRPQPLAVVGVPVEESCVRDG